MNVSNRKCVRTLARRSLRASRTRNLIAVLAIALTTVLFTSLFTIALSINDGFQQNNFRQVGGYSHGGFKYLTEAQYEALKDDPLIGQAGLRRFVGMPTQDPFNKAHVEVSYADANDAHWMYCDPAEGRLPQEGTDEAATDTHVLELLGVEPELGARFTLTFDVDGHETTQTFTLSGWWEYDEAIVANHVLIPESRVDALLEHHARRLDELTAILRARPGSTAYEAAAHMTWNIRSRSWDDFPLAQKWFAVGECIAHLDHLRRQGRLQREQQDGVWHAWAL